MSLQMLFLTFISGINILIIGRIYFHLNAINKKKYCHKKMFLFPAEGMPGCLLPLMPLVCSFSLRRAPSTDQLPDKFNTCICYEWHQPLKSLNL